MSKIISKIFIIGLLVLYVFTLCACEQPEQPTYTLSNSEKQLVNTIYDARGLWETHNGRSCTNIRYVEKNGHEFLLCTYMSGGTGLEIKYTISGNGMHEATADEYGFNDYGLVTGMFDYDTSASGDDKKLSIAKAVTNKSYVVIP